MECDGVGKAVALEERALAVGADSVVLVALSDVDDTAFCCASELWFEATDLPPEALYYRHPGGVFCDVSGGWRSLSGPESSVLRVGTLRARVQCPGCRSSTPWPTEC